MICDFLASFSASAGDRARARRNAQRDLHLEPAQPGIRRSPRLRSVSNENPAVGGQQVRP